MEPTITVVHSQQPARTGDQLILSVAGRFLAQEYRLARRSSNSPDDKYIHDDFRYVIDIDSNGKWFSFRTKSNYIF